LSEPVEPVGETIVVDLPGRFNAKIRFERFHHFTRGKMIHLVVEAHCAESVRPNGQ